MRIYLADLFHTFGPARSQNPYTVPLGIGYLASTLKHNGIDCELRLFRDPDKFLMAVRTAPPHVIGYSISSWNTDLTRRALEAIEGICPSAIAVGGGPSVDDADDQILDVFNMFPCLDYLVPNEGESGFLELIRAIQVNEHHSRTIAGVAYLDNAGNLVRGAYSRPVVPAGSGGVERISPKHVRRVDSNAVEVPSPYLDGTLDEFLDEGLVPIIQTMRGCPYQCSFCVSGATEWNRMRGFDIDRVTGEIDYALSRSRAKNLILTDENWGVLGERDIDIARYIRDRHRIKGSPNRLYYYTAKIVTDASRQIVEMVAPIAWIGEFSMSFQSLNPETRKVIKRTNISLEKLASNIQWASERNIETSSEMIYGFPHETPRTFFDGVERLTREGVSNVLIYPLQLFPGIDLAAKDARARYGFRTRFRLADGQYGMYDEGRLIAAESDEVVVETNWSTESDYFSVRRYGLFQEALMARRYFLELFRLCSAVGFSGEGVIGYLASCDYDAYPALAEILASYRAEAEAELKETSEQVRDSIVDLFNQGKSQVRVKLNVIYSAMIMSSRQAIDELLKLTREYLATVHGLEKGRELVLTYIDEILPNRIVLLSPHVENRISFSTRFDYSKWRSREYCEPLDLLLPQKASYQAAVSSSLKIMLQNFDSSNRASLQEIIQETERPDLMRTLSASDATWPAPGSVDTRLS